MNQGTSGTAVPVRRYRTITTHERVDAAMRARRLGDILLEAGLITKEQLDEALALQTAGRRRLGEVLLDMGCVSEQIMVKVLEFQLGMVRACWSRVEPDAVRLLPRSVAARHLAFPLAVEENRLLVAMADPLDHLALRELGRITKKQPEVYLATRSEIISAIERWYPRQETDGPNCLSRVVSKGNKG